MKRTWRTLVLALTAGGLTGGCGLSAQAAERLSILPRSEARQASYDYSDYYRVAQDDESSPSDDAPPGEEERPADEDAVASPGGHVAHDSCTGGCSDGCGSCCTTDACCGGCCDDGCGCAPWALFDFGPGIDWKIAGWTAASYTWNPDNPADRFNGPVTWTDRSNDFQLNQQYLYFENPTDTGGLGWDVGWRIDALYGTDHRFVAATGLENESDNSQNWNQDHRFYGLVLPQMYAEIAFNDLKVKVGKFYAMHGYFVVPTIGNFFNSLPYTFQYGEPFTHTGILGTYQMTDNLTASAGVVRGWDNFDDTNPNLGYMGGFTYTGPAGGTLAFVSMVSSEASFDPTSDGWTPRYIQSLVYSKTAGAWTYVAQSDFGDQQDARSDGRDAQWYGLNQYLFLKTSDQWSWGGNFEWFKDEDGFRVGGFLATQPDGSLRGLPASRSGFDGDFYQITLGPRWTPNGNWIIRPNCRWDWYDGPANAGGELPYDDGTDSNQFIFGTDVVLTY